MAPPLHTQYICEAMMVGMYFLWKPLYLPVAQVTSPRHRRRLLLPRRCNASLHFTFAPSNGVKPYRRREAPIGCLAPPSRLSGPRNIKVIGSRPLIDVQMRVEISKYRIRRQKAEQNRKRNYCWEGNSEGTVRKFSPKDILSRNSKVWVCSLEEFSFHGSRKLYQNRSRSQLKRK